MSDKQEYAKNLILEHAKDVEFLSIVEMYDDLTDDEASAVRDLINSAHIDITWNEDSNDRG